MQVLFEGEVKPDEVKIYRGFQIKNKNVSMAA